MSSSAYWDIAKEVGLLGAEVGHFAGKHTPFIGTVVNGIEAARHYGAASDAERAGDMDKADYYHDKAGYDLLKAVPGVGTALGMAELAAGTANVMYGGSFHDGMETVGDYTMDIGAMLGIGAFGAPNPIPGTGAPPRRSDRDDDDLGGNNYHDSWGSHAKLRRSLHYRELLEERAKHQQLQHGH